MSARKNITSKLRKYLAATLLVLLACFSTGLCQQSAFKVKDGKMFVEVKKDIGDAALDNFIEKYDLFDLQLKKCLQGKFLDTLAMMGWKVEQNNSSIFVISKLLTGEAITKNPADKILFADKNRSFAERFPIVSRSVIYGYNRFRNKYPFAVRDSVVTFFMKGNQHARRVMLAGSFNDWNPDALAMRKTDSGWIADVKLRPGKYWYKFVVDGGWRVDSDNLSSEGDGMGNTNSVYFKTNWKFSLAGFSNARRVLVSGSFNNWRERELNLVKENDRWVLPVYLYDGTYTYRFIVDGGWITDPANPDRLPNEFNDYNSVVRMGTAYKFRLNGFADAGEVKMMGSFNQWRDYELPMKKVNGGWEVSYTLGPGNYEYRFVVDGKKVVDPNDANIANVPGHSGNSFFILGGNYTFRLKGNANARSVFLAGEFNNWSPNTYNMKKEGNDWVLKVHLSPGKHLYKFVVDGKWIIDPSNKEWEGNAERTGNSVLWVDR